MTRLTVRVKVCGADRSTPVIELIVLIADNPSAPPFFAGSAFGVLAGFASGFAGPDAATLGDRLGRPPVQAVGGLAL